MTALVSSRPGVDELRGITDMFHDELTEIPSYVVEAVNTKKSCRWFLLEPWENICTTQGFKTQPMRRTLLLLGVGATKPLKQDPIAASLRPPMMSQRPTMILHYLVGLWLLSGYDNDAVLICVVAASAI